MNEVGRNSTEILKRRRRKIKYERLSMIKYLIVTEIIKIVI